MSDNKIRESFDPSFSSIRLQALSSRKSRWSLSNHGSHRRFMIHLDHLLITRVAGRTLPIRRLRLVQRPQARARGGWFEERQGRQVDYYQPARGSLFYTTLVFPRDTNVTSLF